MFILFAQLGVLDVDRIEEELNKMNGFRSFSHTIPSAARQHFEWKHTLNCLFLLEMMGCVYIQFGKIIGEILPWTCYSWVWCRLFVSFPGSNFATWWHPIGSRLDQFVMQSILFRLKFLSAYITASTADRDGVVPLLNI